MKIWIWIVIGLVVVFAIIGIFIFSPNDSTTNEFPKSEYTKCVEAAQDRSCEIEILEEQGYVDGIDCIQDYENPICDFDRYNAEVDASNECFGTKPNMVDCMELLK